ncbi:MAG TPA: hypothetical protein VLA34_04340, partial [Candidatus Krumholzibacterium sp.]|nr:hypothetical protein [Candidatus Krumholzibacterium sp.]
RTGGWQGYRGVDFEAMVDLGSERDISRVSAGFLHDQGAWIFLPRKVEFAVATGGDDFTVVASLDNPLDDRQEGAEIWQAASGELGLRARFVRVRATAIGTCPEWHPGAGNKAWIFVDEIEIE